MIYERLSAMGKVAVDGASAFFQKKVVTTKAIDDYMNSIEPMITSNLEPSDVEDEIKLIRKVIEERFYQIMEGELVELKEDEDHEEWFNPSTGLPYDSTGRDVHFWKYYRIYLAQKGKLGAAAINEIDNVTSKIMSRLVDPRNAKDKWAKKGLVMGSVQSGKTGNYTGLIAKAIDNEYKFIIILSGQHKDLRAQTQLRINEELLGYDTKNSLKDSTKFSGSRIGVGLLDKNHRGINVQTLTTSDVDGDFNKAIAERVNPILDGKRTYVLIIKKNVSVMENLIHWLQTSAHAVDKKIRNVPMLLIDDECDQASIDTTSQKNKGQQDDEGYSIEDPTATNQRIRRLLNTFSKSAYVGYTATPFANIFIDSKGKNREIGKDLFPRNFIYSLKRPSSYVGPEEFFGLRSLKPDAATKRRKKARGQPSHQTKDNIIDDSLVTTTSHDVEDDENVQSDPLPLQRPADDAKDVYIKKHKTDLVVAKLPNTLLKAVKSFLLTIAARQIRETSNSHSSMLVHVSRYQLVMDQTKQLLLKVLEGYVNKINVPGEPLDDFRKIWEEDFGPTTAKINKIANQSSKPERWGSLTKITWEEIRNVLPIVSTRVTVKAIHGNSDDILDYTNHSNKYGSNEKWEERGIHTIVVGGDKLSRGLTLEGLTVSYYLRATNMYDTLMQMGRWFGYRDGFLDLCRLYSTREIFVHFSQVATAEKDLREQLIVMAKRGGTPSEFGLYVLQSPGNLIVTSKRKQGAAQNISINFGGCGPETTMFSPSQRDHNWKTLTTLISRLDNETTKKKVPKNLQWTGVSRDIVAEFLENYSAHKQQALRTAATAKFIRKQDEKILKHWDVVCVRYAKKPKDTPTMVVNKNELHAMHRTATDYNEQRLYVKRTGGPKDETLDLNPSEMNDLIKRYGKQGYTGAEVRTVRDQSKGLLLIYILCDPNGKKFPYGPSDKYPGDHHYVHFLVSFPEDRNNSFKAEEILANDVYIESDLD